ncbi:serine/threonine-protein kinase-like protein CCR4 [Tanacetum coccineum]
MAKTFILLTLILLIIPSLITSLATVSISNINSNQILICALTKSHAQQQQINNLNCTTTNSPANIQLPSTSNTRFSYVGIVGGNRFVCALSSPFFNASGILVSFLACWRFDAYGNSVFKRVYLGPSLKEIDSSDSHVCGIVDVTNELLCWQWNGFNAAGSRFGSNVAVGEYYVCGLSEMGQIKCLSSNNSNSNNVTDSVPSGTYSHISTGYNRACAINSSSELNCWGDTMIWKPNGVFKSVSMGDNRFCAIRDNGTVICRGENGFGLPKNLQNESFEGLQVSRGVFCGVSTGNYSLYCWGNESLDSNSIVFGDVVPGLCTSTCPCGKIPNYGTFCGGGLMICKPCVCNQAPPQSAPPRNGGWSSKMIAFAVVGSVGSLSFIIVLLFLFFRCCKSSEGSRVHDSGPMEDIQIAARIQASNRILVKKLSHLVSMGTGNPLEEFALQTILDATDNFSDDHRIGIGSFGSVYRGLLTNGRKVAVKRAESHSSSSGPSGLKKRQEDTNNAFVSELEFLSRVNHKNLVQLLGFCEEENELVLVYEFMENGSLHDHLHNLFSSYIMSWPARIKVALDAARGLEYLHVYADPPIIHRDIKSSNILLDEEWNGKVSDFGLSLMGPCDGVSHLSLRAAGTVGYMDPEYYKFEQLTSKSDVYSFGVVLLELLSGHHAIQKNEEGERRNVVESVVPYIENEQIHRILDHKVPPPTPFEIESVKYVGYLAADCVTLEGRDRPTMSELVTCLERAFEACFTIPSFSHSSNSSFNGISRVSV